MKLVLNIAGILLIFIGAIWFLQGIGVLLGSFMSNQVEWVMIGLLTAGIGTGLLILNHRQRKRWN